jgi:spore maturation protein CgeB
MELYIDYNSLTINNLCKLFGKTKQAYYQRIKYNYQDVVKDDILKQMVKEERKYMPRIGGRKLLYIINNQLPDDMQMGRDSFFDWLRSNNLLVRKTRTRVITTNSYHWLRKYPNLIKGYIPTSPNELWVSDITYIRTIEGVLFLYLVTEETEIATNSSVSYKISSLFCCIKLGFTNIFFI